jgi:hypothetical protein
MREPLFVIPHLMRDPGMREPLFVIPHSMREPGGDGISKTIDGRVSSPDRLGLKPDLNVK